MRDFFVSSMQPVKSAVVLVVDDNPKVKYSLEIGLPQYQVVGKSNAEEALRFLDQPNEVDVVILDVRMEGMSGLDLLKQIKNKRPLLPVMILTGYGTRETLVEALRERADDFLDKPFNIAELRDKLQKLLEVAQRHQMNSGTLQSPINRIIQFIQRNCLQDLALEQAAKVVSMSPKYLSRKFKEQTGKSFTEFRVGLRMEHAKSLLSSTCLNVNQIAENIGYENPESFMKMFKKISGSTPSEYRECASKK